MPDWPRLRLASLLALALLGSAACSSDEDGAPSPLEDATSGEDARTDGDEAGDADVGRDPADAAGEDPDPTDAEGEDAADGDPALDTGSDAEEETSPDAADDVRDAVCVAGQVGCMDARSVGVCRPDESGLDLVTACPEGHACGEGADGRGCYLWRELRCEAETFLACEDALTQRRCGPLGRALDPEPCPPGRPLCREEALGCVEDRCTPGELACVGETLVRCDEAGQRDVTRCRYGCADAACVDPCQRAVDEDSYLGCEFWAVWLDQFRSFFGGGPQPSLALAISNASPYEADVLIEDSLGRFVTGLTLEPNGLALVPVPLPDTLLRSTRIEDTAWRVRSTSLVTVHQFNPPDNIDQYSNDASLLLPAHAFGTEYMVLGWPTVSPDNGGVLAVVASALGETRVTIETSTLFRGGPGIQPLPGRSSRNFFLQQGEVLYLRTEGDFGARYDMTGTLIRSSRPVAAFSSHQCANVPIGTGFCDHLEQQLLPTSAWDRLYVLAKMRPRGVERDVYRILALKDGTLLNTIPPIAGIDGERLAPGEVLEVATDEDFVLQASQEISVGQFMVGSAYRREEGADFAIPRTCESGSGIGDPAFLINVPSSQFLDSYTFYVPAQYAENAITVIGDASTSLMLDGEPLASAGSVIGETSWAVWRLEVAPGVRRLNADRPIGLYVYGYDCDVSYAYPGGMRLAPR